MRVVKLVYEDGTIIEPERESQKLIDEISKLSAMWSMAVYAKNTDELLAYSPRWCEICEKVFSFWGQLGGLKLPASKEENEADPLKNRQMYRRP